MEMNEPTTSLLRDPNTFSRNSVHSNLFAQTSEFRPASVPTQHVVGYPPSTILAHIVNLISYCGFLLNQYIILVKLILKLPLPLA